MRDPTDDRDHEGRSVTGESPDHLDNPDNLASMDQEGRTDLRELLASMASTETGGRLASPANLAFRARSDQQDSLVATANLATRE